MSFELALDYIDVATRLEEFFAKYPDGCLQQVEASLVEINGQWGWRFTAAAYRSPDDARPGMGTAWEPVPGKTPYTRNSELQNAETAAWGRALVALGASTKKGIASAEEVRNRREPEAPKKSDAAWVLAARKKIAAASTADELEAVRPFLAQGVEDGKCSEVDRVKLGEEFTNRQNALKAAP